jgi:hypothetical protein
LELYIQSEQDDGVRHAVEEFVHRRPGIALRVYDLRQDDSSGARLDRICAYFKKPRTTPAVYGCGLLVLESDAARVERQLQALATLEVFVRAGCPHCADARAYLPALLARFPGFTLRVREITSDATANRDLQTLTYRHGTAAASVPVFHFCNQLVVGFDSAATTGRRLETLLERWTRECPTDAKQTTLRPWNATRLAVGAGVGAGWFVSDQESDQSDALPLPDEATLPLPGDDELPLPGEGADAIAAPVTDAIDLPVFGRVSRRSLGLPLFTVAVGLVDGFNPCAMWVLLFLLSILVNLHNRWKILAVAGTFVAISGLAYLAFMAAWLSVFMWVGLLPWVRNTLAVLAIVIGAIHVKDFFAFKRGVSLSIPEAAKPGIYERMRRIVTAENVAGAVMGAAVLAVLVNMIELLCTAGLPALYTQILTAQGLPLWLNYAYLLLYIGAYMLDDSLMVGLVVVTLRRRKLQEMQGRWLKLVSGGVILGLGCVMLLRPGWIGMSG